MLSTEFCRRYPLAVASRTASHAASCNVELIEADRRLDVKGDRAGVLANRCGLPLGQADVGRDKFQREVGTRSDLFQGTMCLDDLAHIMRQEGRGSANEFENLRRNWSMFMV